jgi:malate permease and related proteins
MQFGSGVQETIVLFSLLAAGFAAFKLRVFGEESITGMTNVLLKLCLPAMILMSMQKPRDAALFRESGLILGNSFAAYALFFLFALPLPRLLKARPGEAGSYRYAVIFSNVGFMGLPVLNALYGKDAVFLGSIYNIPFHLLAYSVGLLVLCRPQAGEARLKPSLFLSPAFVATLAGFALFLASVRLPVPVGEALDLLGGTTTPLSMILIGGILGSGGVGRLLRQWRIYAVSLLRLLVVPLLLLLGLWALRLPYLLVAVPVTIAAMPVAANAPILARAYGGDAETGSALVFVSTLLSILSLPMIAALVGVLCK